MNPGDLFIWRISPLECRNAAHNVPSEDLPLFEQGRKVIFKERIPHQHKAGAWQIFFYLEDGTEGYAQEDIFRACTVPI